MATKPILYLIPAFDADFDASSAPVFKFSWEGGVIHQNRLVILDNSTNTMVYDCKITTMAHQHPLQRSVVDSLPVNEHLKNGQKYKARIYVYTSDGVESPASDWCYFYCFHTPEFQFTNFETTEDVSIINTSSINLSVKYSDKQTASVFRNPLKSYHFELEDYHGAIIHTSDTKYSSAYEDILRYSLSGMDETRKDHFGNIVFDEAYTIICKGETQHGMLIYTEQKFVVKLESTGVGSLIKVTNVGDGRVLISSNYKVMNANCSAEQPIYLKDENQVPYAVDLTSGEYVEFTDGFNIRSPYEMIFKGVFPAGELITLRTQNRTAKYAKSITYDYGVLGLGKITYTHLPYYYFYFTVERDGISHEIRSDYFNYLSDSVAAEVDLSYHNGLYNLNTTIDYGDEIYLASDNDKGNVQLCLFTKHSITEDEDGNITLLNDNLLISDDNNGHVTISAERRNSL